MNNTSIKFINNILLLNIACLILLLNSCGQNPEYIDLERAQSDSEYLDSDNDGVPDQYDAFPFNPNKALIIDEDLNSNNTNTDDSDLINSTATNTQTNKDLDEIQPVITDTLTATDNETIPTQSNPVEPITVNPITTKTDTNVSTQPTTLPNKTGATLYAELNCANCHGDDGKGVKKYKTILDKLDNEDILEKMIDTMPFGNPTACDELCSTILIDWMRDEFKSDASDINLPQEVTPIESPIEPETSTDTQTTNNAENSNPSTDIADGNGGITYETNIAIAKKVTQSSVAFDGFAQNANDENNNNFNHTASENHPWWEIDLGQKQFIDNVILFSRKDFDDRSRNLHIAVSTMPITAISYEQALEDSNITLFNTGDIQGSANISVQTQGQYIRVIGYRQYINFAEFQVFGGALLTPIDLTPVENQNYCTDTDAAKNQTLRLLTNLEYQHTINDIFKLSELNNITNNFPGNTNTGGYDNNSQNEIVNEARMNGYWLAAQTIAKNVVNHQLNDWTDCTQLEESCAQSLIENIGFRLMRRPVTNEELSNYSNLLLSANSFNAVAENIFKAMLMSPQFLYRHEIGIEVQGNYQLNNFEAATLLSYTFFGSTPDTELLNAAKDGLLQTQDQLRGQVKRMLKKPSAQTNFIHFAKQWFKTQNITTSSKDADIFPEFSQEIAMLMNKEFELFSVDVLLGNDKQLNDLFNADYTFSNHTLAEYYDLDASTNEFEKITAGSQRGGILKMGAVMASHANSNSTSPILRGQFVRERVMCHEIPQPPQNADLTVPPLDLSKPTRERFEAHTQVSSCQACHQYMDPIGFALESFDGAGKFRFVEAQISIDTSGEIIGLDDIFDVQKHAFNGADGLIELLANSDNTASCVVDQFDRFSSGVSHSDTCTVSNTAARWKENNYSFEALWLEMVSSKLYLIRQ